jgi:hypothetical protein
VTSGQYERTGAYGSVGGREPAGRAYESSAAQGTTTDAPDLTASGEQELHRKPPVAERLKGNLETMAGKVTGDPAKVEKGQARKVPFNRVGLIVLMTTLRQTGQTGQDNF